MNPSCALGKNEGRPFAHTNKKGNPDPRWEKKTYAVWNNNCQSQVVTAVKKGKTQRQIYYGTCHPADRRGPQSARKYRLVLLCTCCALTSGGTTVWWTTCGLYMASTGGILSRVSKVISNASMDQSVLPVVNAERKVFVERILCLDRAARCRLRCCRSTLSGLRTNHLGAGAVRTPLILGEG